MYPVGHQGTGPLGLRAKCLSNKSEPGVGGGSTSDLEATLGGGGEATSGWGRGEAS